MNDLKWIAEKQRRHAYGNQVREAFGVGMATGLMWGAVTVGFIWIFWNAGVTCTGA